MTDFAVAVSTPGVHHPNLPAPGKRPRSSMSPTIALRDGESALTFGSPGGATIIRTVLQVLLAHVDLGLSLPDAITAPRATQRNAALTGAEPEFSDTPLRHELTSRYREQCTGMANGTFIGDATGLDILPDGRVHASVEPGQRCVVACSRAWRRRGRGPQPRGAGLVIKVADLSSSLPERRNRPPSGLRSADDAKPDRSWSPAGHGGRRGGSTRPGRVFPRSPASHLPNGRVLVAGLGTRANARVPNSGHG